MTAALIVFGLSVAIWTPFAIIGINRWHQRRRNMEAMVYRFQRLANIKTGEEVRVASVPKWAQSQGDVSDDTTADELNDIIEEIQRDVEREADKSSR
jgi:hypothetical protein